MVEIIGCSDRFQASRILWQLFGIGGIGRKFGVLRGPVPVQRIARKGIAAPQQIGACQDPSCRSVPDQLNGSITTVPLNREGSEGLRIRKRMT